MDAVTTGDYNTGLGVFALTGETTGAGSTAIGYAALYTQNSTSSADMFNTAVGNSAGVALTTAVQCTLIGKNAGAAITTGSENTAVGYISLDALTTATGNVAVGYNSGGAVTTGNNNVSLGSAAGVSITTGQNNVCVGYNAQPPAADTDHSITLGDAQITNLRCNDTSISSLSDQRDKTNIVDIPLGLDFINTTRPVSFDWNRRDGTSVGEKDFGFIAQELKIAADATIYADHMRLVHEEDPDRLEADPMKMFPILVKAIQELSAKVAALEAK
jgi:hypothetical protein